MIKTGIDESAIHEEFKALAKKLKVPVIDMYYDLQVIQNGNILAHAPKQRSHSFNRNAFNWMFSELAAYPFPDVSFGASYISLKDTGGSIRSDSTDGIADGYNSYVAAVGDATEGIVIGTGAGAESFDGYQLTTKVVHGNGGGQMHYSDSEISYAWDGGTLTFTTTLIRYFNNNSGGTIVITEIGLYAKLPVYFAMVTRDLLDPSVSCVDASQLKATYEVDLIYPE